MTIGTQPTVRSASPLDDVRSPESASNGAPVRVALSSAHPVPLANDEYAAPDYLAELAPDLSLEMGHEREATTEQQVASATAVLRVMRAIQRDMDAITETRRLEIASIEAIRDRELAPLRERFNAMQRYVATLAELIDWPKRKASHDTPYGTFGVRKSSATVRIADMDALVAWADAHKPSLMRATYKLDWAALKQTIDPSEDVLPDGVERVEATVTPYVKVS